MKQLFSLLLFGLITFNICFAQGVISTALTNNGNLLSVVDVDGKPFKFVDAEVEGHVFLTDEWQTGNIQLNNGTVAKNVKIKLNLYNNYLHFLNNKDVEMYKEANEIKMIEIIDGHKKDSILQVFKTYESEKNGKKSICFYEQLTNGNISFLKLVGKKLVTSKNEFNKEITKKFVQYEDYFIYKNNDIKELKRKQSFFEEIMNDKWRAVEKFTDKNNFGFKTIADICSVINYYNKIL